VLRLSRIFKNYREAGSLNDQINLFGFINEHTFLTKSGDLGVILQVRGVDYECLDGTTVDSLTKRLESGLRLFDENYRVYQYLFKRSNPGIPYRLYGNTVVDAAILNRIRYLAGKSDKLFSVSLYYVVLYEGSRLTRTIASFFAQISDRPLAALSELKARLSTKRRLLIDERELARAESTFREKTRSFVLQVSDFVSVGMLRKDDAFRVLTQILNFAPDKIENARLKHDTFLDYYVPASHLECHRGHLRVDDYYVKVLSLKEPSAQTFPLILKRLLEIQANFHVVTEWKKEDPGKTRHVIQAKRRHFHNTKRSFWSQVNLNDASPEQMLHDDSKESQVRELGESIRQIELHGNYFGRFSLTVVLYELEMAAVERAAAEIYKVFSVHDAQLYEERYNLLNAFLAAVPGNRAFNLRYLYLLNTNYADLSFLFTLDSGQVRNEHLRQEYLAILETNHGTPYFLNLHSRDVAHSLILGRTGAGKSFLLNFIITNLQKYAPHTFIFDLGGSFESLTKLFGGSYVSLGVESHGFSINPFALPPTKENLDFLTLFTKVLAGGADCDPATEREIYQQVESLYTVDVELRTLGVLRNTLPRQLAERLGKWTRGGQFGFLFDNTDDTVSFARFQCFDFQRMSQYPEVLEPLLFYILHRTNVLVRDKDISSVFKAFFIDEAWVFLRNLSIQKYVIEALKTWRKHNAAMILSTQSVDELRRSEMLDVVLETCATKIFLANPDMDRELYRGRFHLNEQEIDLISGLIPKQQFLLKTPDLAKVANLSVDAKSYWLYTNDPYDNRKRQEALEQFGFERGLEVLAEGQL
jgi:type IV secretion/conjugal transfer VirB4 family ATPase